MQLFIVLIIKYILRILYFPMKILIKEEKKIVYVSRQRNEKSTDIALLEKEIREHYPEFRQVFRLKMLEPGIFSAIRYGFWILGDMIQIAGASVVVCDTYSIPVSCLKHKESLKVVQIWHAMGAIKKFGWQSVGKAEGRSKMMSKALQMHANYDIVMAPSKATARFYSQAFHTPLKKMKLAPLPHVDIILDGQNKRDLFDMDHPELKEKKIVLYLPTFREGENEIINSLRKSFDQTEEMELIIHLHPLSTARSEDFNRINGSYSTFDLMKLSDAIITDYSACAFEAALLEKPLYFYTPDYESYQNSRGLNVDLKTEMKDYIYEDPDSLIEAIQSEEYDDTDLKVFQKKYIEKKSHCTERMAALICTHSV